MSQTIEIEVSDELAAFIAETGKNCMCSESETAKMLLVERVRELEADETHQWVPPKRELDE